MATGLHVSISQISLFQLYPTLDFRLTRVKYQVSRLRSDLTTDFHDLLKVETKTIYSSSGAGKPVAFKEQPAPKRGRERSRDQMQQGKKLKKGDSFGMALLRVVGVFVIMGVAYFAWTAYRAQQGGRF
jgi:hypothetical protein